MYSSRLRELRENKDVTQAEVAKNLGIVGNRYGQYEREYGIMPIKHLNAVCNYFDVSLDYVFNFVSCMQYENVTKEIDLKKLGNRLKTTRKSLALTQDLFAKKLNVKRTIITEYENGNYLISTTVLFRICKLWGISADYLLGRVDEPMYFSDIKI